MIATYPLATALTIASSDSSGGAGIQADLKTFASLGVYGLTVISAVTAQNTLAVTMVENLSPALVTAQLEALWADIKPKAIKIGLIGSAANAQSIEKFLRVNGQGVPVVLDPVLVSASGHVFLSEEDMAAVVKLFPLATLITPNIPETEALTGVALTAVTSKAPDLLKTAAQALLAKGPKNILIKGGHGLGPTADDYLFNSEGEPTLFSGPRIETRSTHGTGCTLSSAIAAGLAQDLPLPEAIKRAKDYVAQAFLSAPPLGHGPGPLNHFHQYYAWRADQPVK
ncbi:MAG: bifunctional hydroxymethylpyrimidine kinase/phosphomethylpyrimidine kinase [Deltaproteobacteria bacterium]|nr:bifunctional hydroxymethylpyrimidine kinase/phosphomethylpyrimidine kinase [Deltaproteobacteria bacterium]